MRDSINLLNKRDFRKICGLGLQPPSDDLNFLDSTRRSFNLAHAPSALSGPTTQKHRLNYSLSTTAAILSCCCGCLQTGRKTLLFASFKAVNPDRFIQKRMDAAIKYLKPDDYGA
jgi:hypothetical protein